MPNSRVHPFIEMNLPRIERHGFGWIIVDGRRWDRDIIITAHNQVVLRPKHLSKKYGGWHTVLGPEEMGDALAGDPEILLIGCGHFGLLPIRQETRALLAERGVTVEIARLPRTKLRFERLARDGKRVAAILHLTC
jgi:hypothetical protein